MVDALKKENTVSTVHASKRFCCELSFDHFNMNGSCGKVMFSQASVIMFMLERGKVYIISYWNALFKIVSSN